MLMYFSSGQLQLQAAVQTSNTALREIATGVQMLVESQHYKPAEMRSKERNTTVIPPPILEGDFQESGSALLPNSGIVSTFNPPSHSTYKHMNLPQYPISTFADNTTKKTLNSAISPGRQNTNGQDIVVPNGSANSVENMYRGSCQIWCSCRCHQKLSCHSKAGVMSILGFLFMCLSVGRYAWQSCDEPLCFRRQELKMKVAFVFPPWLLAHAMCFMLTISSLGTPKFTPRWSATFSGDAKIFTCAIEGDLDGLRKLFEKRAASPHDVAASTGRTALHVSSPLWKLLNLFQPLSQKSVCRSVQPQRDLPLPARPRRRQSGAGHVRTVCKMCPRQRTSKRAGTAGTHLQAGVRST